MITSSGASSGLTSNRPAAEVQPLWLLRPQPLRPPYRPVFDPYVTRVFRGSASRWPVGSRGGLASAGPTANDTRGC